MEKWCETLRVLSGLCGKKILPQRAQRAQRKAEGEKWKNGVKPSAFSAVSAVKRL
jgi:hypothetical protein